MTRRARWIRYAAISAIMGIGCAGVFGAIKAVRFVKGAIQYRKHELAAAAQEPAAVAAWRADFGDPRELLASFPKENANPTAIAFATASRELGIEMSRVKRADSTGGSIPANLEPFKSIREYDEGELKKVDSPISEPSQSTSSFMETHRAALDQIVALLVKSEPPRWELDMARGSEGPIPNLLGILRTQRLLAAEALMRAGRGDNQAAENALRASWNLNSSLRDRPEVITQLVAGRIAQMQAGVARRLPVISAAEWRARFQEHDYRASLLRAMVAETAGHLAAFPDDRSTFNRAARADLMNQQRQLLVSLRDSPLTTKRDGAVDRVASREPNPLSAGEILGSIGMPNLANAWRRADRLTIDLEFTGKILEAKEQRSHLGRWPSQIPGFEKSAMAGAQWVYSVAASGRVSISLSTSLEWPSQQGHEFTLPLEYVEE